MWLSLNMISRMVDVSGLDPEEIANRLTMSTAEIEGIEHMNPWLKDVITAKILDVRPHPNADKLTVCDIDCGKERHTVVCGAPNHKKGDVVAFAPVGTVFGEEMTIKKAKIRGVESTGMLCSDRELGLSDDHSGIKIFTEDTATGQSLATLFPDWVDVRFEIDNKSITHRPDLWSHSGFAREISALFGRPFRSAVNYDLEKELRDLEPVKVSIADPAAAPRYSALVMKNIAIGDSPEWMKANVTAIGMRPINNIVDVTNFVMTEIGEPMHAFDKWKLRGGEIIVRMAKKSETITTLDGKDFELNEEDIVIADKEGAIALAGVMGGANSEIEDATCEIVLEAACFNPVNIRKTAQRYNQRTEAAIRFEKSLSPELTKAALIRCYDLIRQMIPGAEAVSLIIDAYPQMQKPVTISTTTDFIRTRLGESIDDGRIAKILESLDFRTTAKFPNITVEVPQYRATKDISIPEDLVEEIGRIHGYGNITPAPPLFPCAAPRRNEFRLFERRVRHLLSGDLGMIEVSGYSFTGKEILDRLGVNGEKELLLANPLSIEHDRLRRSIIPNMVKHIALNQKFQDQFQIYEMGRVYLKEKRMSKDLPDEQTMAAGACFRRKNPHPAFYDAKNAALGLLERLRIAGTGFMPKCEGLPPYCHPGRSAEITAGGKAVGTVFELHPDTRQAFDISGQVALFEIDCTALYGAETIPFRFSEIQKFPEVPFEISVLADTTTYGDALLTIIRGCDHRVRSSHVISVFEGDTLPKGKKSVSIKTIFASDERTLSTEDVFELQQKVIGALGSKGFQLR
jgi:phenylalanyl-tRNA synthetase beta chain